MLHKLMLLSASFLVSSLCVGCVSIRTISPTGPHAIANCSSDHGSRTEPDECGELCDQRNGIRRLVNQLRPVKVVPVKVIGWASACKDRTATWMSSQCGRCAAAKSSVHDWIQAKREEANAPPWPRFHPVPTQNVFSPQPSDASESPEVYGRFGKE